MKKLLLRMLFFLVPFLWWVYSSAQPKNEKDCSTTCFSSEVVSVQKLSDTCTSYELKVSFSGDCAHALSHYSVAIPCGQVSDIWNSAGWKHEIGTDPTTGISGFKIDDISDFGDGNLSSFTVKFNVCSTGHDCEDDLKCWQPQVAYKAATCVNYEVLEINCKPLKASLVKRDASCFGSHDGSLEVVVSDGVGPYAFTWSDGFTGQTRDGLPAGNYAVVVRDASGSEVALEGIIGQPTQIAITATSVPARCDGTSDGAIDIDVTGGTGAYTFQWNTGAETEDIQSIRSGQYAVIVTDENQCTASTVVLVGSSSNIYVASTHVRPDCNDANGSIDLSVGGGNEPYSFEWSNGSDTEDLTNIAAGVYTVTITDNAGCSTTRSLYIRDNNTLRLSASSSPASCSGDTSGQIDLTVSGGTSPYTFEWSNGETTEDISNLISGQYIVTVVDAKGCTVTGSFAVSKTTFQVPRTIVQPACHGDNNGSITLQDPVGGTGPFTYEWSTGDTSTSLNGLSPGTYSVTVTDATGCSRTITAVIIDPAPLSVSATVSNSDCNTDGHFSVDLQVLGGTAPYTYQWSDGPLTEDRNGLASGSYTVIITDARGCSMAKEVLVEGVVQDWICLINEPAIPPVCGSAGNILSASLSDADAYAWTVESTDGAWKITDGINTSSVSFNAGTVASTATFTVTITKGGCSRSCSYTISACTSDNSENPGPGEPGGETPGNETCEECFTTTAKLVQVSGSCRTYEMEVTTNGLCRHDLSHWTLAIPCGSVSNYSNSRNWKMEYGMDPTTGVYGLKVDDIQTFGKDEDSFTVRFTVCESIGCEFSSWDPTVAYKAGQCVGFETISDVSMSEGDPQISVYPNPFAEEIHFAYDGGHGDMHVEVFDQYGNIVSHMTESSVAPGDGSVTLRSSSLPKGIYYYRMTVGGNIYNGKISKR